ncbi:MAG: signal peptidase I [Acidobacteria bacterium RIFCSPLOWO2_02_FULL_65_29]|nr:MAG: signal peptidase I [Acidobacteria bacterium RIFCSPLOWO2_02_FULL_65_29]
MKLIWGSNPRATLLRAGTIVAIAFVVFRFILLPVRLQGISMLPSYEDGALNFANRLSYTFAEPKRGDVIAIRMAGLSVVYVKRIIGLPGETVEIVAGTVVIDEEPLVEPTVMYRIPWNMPALTLGAGEYFVVGDNRSMKMENHDFGRASRGRIVGKLLF